MKLTEILEEILKTAEDFPIHDVKSDLLDALPSPRVELLTRLASKKYQLILAYIHYGDQLRANFRDGIFKHFQEHLEEEREQLYQINKKVTALGGDTNPNPDKVPNVPLEDARSIFQSLEILESQSVELWSELFRQSEHDIPLNGMAQNYATECQGHADDMKRYLRSVP